MVFGWLKKERKEDDFEKLLEQIDAEIRQCELDLSSIAIAQRRITNAWIFYASATYITGISFYILFVKSNRRNQDVTLALMQMMAIILGPFLYLIFYHLILIRIYGVQLVIKRWFERQRQTKVELLAELRGKQQLKVEELKKKTSYYVTKGLIERYETPDRNLKTNNINPASNTGNRIITNPGNTDLNNRPLPQQDPLFQTPTQRPPAKVEDINKIRQGGITPLRMDHSGKTPSSIPRNSWIDKVLDAIVGESDGPQHKYALVCENCFVHNGLVLPSEYPNAKFKCLKCDHLNVKNTSISYPDREDEPNQVADNHFTKVDNSEPKAECHAE